MRALEREEDGHRRELIDRREEPHHQESTTLGPMVAIAMRARDEDVVRAHGICLELVWLIEHGNVLRKIARDFTHSEEPRPPRAGQMPEMVVAEFVPENEPKRLVEDVMLARDATGIGELNRIEKSSRRF
jgi:hypothetical protein